MSKEKLTVEITNAKEKIYTWQHIYTKKIAEVKAKNERLSGNIAINLLSEFGEDNEITLIKIEPLCKTI